METVFVIVLLLIKLIVGVTALVVLLSFAVAWYERANTRPDLIERRFTGRGVCIAIWLLIHETTCLLLTIAIRPLGWRAPQFPEQTAEAGTPIILLHGLFQNRSCLFWLQWRLRSVGHRKIISINTPPWRDLESLTEQLVKTIDELKIRTRIDKAILVGHSMGGMIARNYIQNRGGAAHVNGLITLGTPHHGSKLAPFAISAMGRNLLPGSSFLTRINSTAWPAGVKSVSIFTRYDNIVLPAEAAVLTGSEIVELDGMGHTGLLFHPRAIQAVIRAVNEMTP